jgi:glycine/D-amino acid oxidase-like deaminating enzyme
VRPPLDKSITADVAIIGAGITGLSTARHLSQRYAYKRIVILEADQIASGATGRNGGLVLTGFPGLFDSEPEAYGRYYKITKTVIDDIEKTIADNDWPVDFKRGGTLEFYNSEAGAKAAEEEISRRRTHGVDEQFLSSSVLKSKCDAAGVVGAVFDPWGAHLNSADWVLQLASWVESRGVHIYEKTRVTRIREGKTIEVECGNHTVRANAIVLATNAYTPLLGYFSGNIVPLHSYIVATEALSSSDWESLGWRGPEGFSDDRDRLAYGSMTGKGELVFGGGSNGTYDYVFGSKPRLDAPRKNGFDTTEGHLRDYFPQLEGVSIAKRWTGPIALTLNRMSTVGVRGEHGNIFYGCGYSGCGIVTSNLAGKIICDLYSGNPEPWADLPFVHNQPPWVPPEPFRWVGYQAFTRLTGRSPRKG